MEIERDACEIRFLSKSKQQKPYVSLVYDAKLSSFVLMQCSSARTSDSDPTKLG